MQPVAPDLTVAEVVQDLDHLDASIEQNRPGDLSQGSS